MKAKRVLCGGEGHPAPYRGCPRLVELKKMKQRTVEAEAPRKNRITRIDSLVNRAKSYSDITKRQTDHREAGLERSQSLIIAYNRVSPKCTRNTPKGSEKRQLGQISEVVSSNTNRINAIFRAISDPATVNGE